MDKNEILSILNDWNFWKNIQETGIDRIEYINKIRNFLGSNHISVITGARRSGKSFIMRQLAKFYMNNNIGKEQILIINFEDPRFIELNVNTLQRIYETYLEFLKPKNKPYIFLDEIQEVKDWEKWVLSIQELQKAKIIISGSNAKLLSTDLSTLLTGRHLDLVVFPLSFREFIVFNNLYIKDELDIVNKKIEIKSLLREYLEFGSFPEVVLTSQKKEILLHYFEDILNKDLIKRFKIRKSEKLRSLAKFYMSNISNLISFNSIEKFLEISADTIEKFSSYFEDAYLLFFLKRFSFKVKQQEKSPKKVYCIDPGLANTMGFKFSENIGKIAENIVFLELKRREIENPYFEIFYWKDEYHREVDFLIKEGTNSIRLIQVCWNLERIETKNREIRSLLKSMELLDIKEGLIITEDYENEENINNKKIKFIPLWKWLL